ncbi:MAG: HAD family hydrolase [Candidatus Omnitrophica bacterium]|nr:HAD family hydrolase [Candidatus Omnitrophota bacterium]
MSWECVIFDCDGVLVDSEPVANRILAEFLTDLGLPTTTEESIALYMGRSSQDIRDMALKSLGRPLPEHFFEEFNEKLLKVLAQETHAVPGITEVLDHIPYPVCVASSGTHAKMELTLGNAGLLERFKGRIYSATEVPRGKPYPDLFLHAAEQMKAQPSRCVVVEDSAPGVQAGIAAGMKVLGYTRLAEEALLQQAGALTFADMANLPGLLSHGSGSHPKGIPARNSSSSYSS